MLGETIETRWARPVTLVVGRASLARPSLHAGGGFDLEKTSLIPSGEEIGGMFSPLPAGAGAADG